VVYTDGACLGNPGPGGWAWAVPEGPYASGGEPHTTNQRMEIRAALEAVTANGSEHEPLEVISDSAYVVNCFRDRWWEGWIRRGWRNSQNKPVANRELWEPLIELVQRFGNVTFRWVKGHSGDRWNDIVDRLAVEAAETQQGRRGGQPPTELGDAKAVAARAMVAGDARAGGETFVEGYRVAVFGHRPNELGGEGEHNPLIDALRDHLVHLLDDLAARHADLVVLSGLRLGAEMTGAEAAVTCGVPFVAVLPYPDPETAWPPEAQARFRHLLGRAREVIILDRRRPESKQHAAASLRRRDAWLCRFADEAILVWDGHDEHLGRLYRSLTDHLGDDVTLVDPATLATTPEGSAPPKA
ncbi:MAG: SLOG family protein, partial [Acidimicrobiales bacterium]|nr:SLOG family protein [Acidimicrobiales bacterium]